MLVLGFSFDGGVMSVRTGFIFYRVKSVCGGDCRRNTAGAGGLDEKETIHQL